jgi:hypothetical protein
MGDVHVSTTGGVVIVQRSAPLCMRPSIVPLLPGRRKHRLRLAIKDVRITGTDDAD